MNLITTINQKFLDNQRFSFYAICIWGLLMLLMWHLPFKTDDLYHRVVFLGSDYFYSHGLEVGRTDKSLLEAINTAFSFVDAGSPDHQAKMAFGGVPWWSHEQLKVSFWRPLTAFTHWLDYQLWPDNPVLMGYHTLLWHLGTLLIVASLFRKLGLSVWLASVAFLLFLLDGAFLAVLSWIANRNAVLAMFWGAVTFWLFVSWRQNGSPSAAAGSLLAFVLALLSAEAGIAIAAYLFAYMLCLDKAPLVKKALVLLPYGVVIILWRAAYTSMGYGAAHSGLYQDPLADSTSFLLGVMERLSVLLFYLYSGLDSSYLFLSSDGKLIYLAVALVFLIVVGIVLWRNFRHDSLVQFAVLGSGLSLLPSCAAVQPDGRLPLFAVLGGVIVIAKLIERLKVRVQAKLSWLSVYLVVVHIGLFGTLWVVSAVAKLVVEHTNVPSSVALDTAAPLNSKGVFIVNMPFPMRYAFLHFYRDYNDLPKLDTVQVLAPSYTDLRIERLSEDVLQISNPDGLNLIAEADPGTHDPSLFNGHYTAKRFSDVFRGPGSPFKVGDEVDMGPMVVRVVEVTDSGDAAVVLYHIKHRLIDQYSWLQWVPETKHYQRFELPDVGQVKVIASSF